MKICILYGGTSAEREVSLKTGQAIFDSINDDCDAFLYDFNGNCDLLKNNLNNVDLVFNALHGGDGENGIIQRFLESEKIKFTGSDSISSKKSMKKNITKNLCKENNILTPNWVYYEKNISAAKFELDMFLFYGKNIVIKPSDEGSSIGLSMIESFYFNDKVKRKMFDESVLKCHKVSRNILIEEYIKGRELTVGIIGNEVLPVLEIVPSNNYYDYECKYTKGKSRYIVPAEIDKKTQQLLSAYSLKIHKLVGCGSYSRSDFRLSEDGKIYFLEINTLPGFTDTSLFPKAAMAAGINYNDLINKIIKLSI